MSVMVWNTQAGLRWQLALQTTRKGVLSLLWSPDAHVDFGIVRMLLHEAYAYLEVDI